MGVEVLHMDKATGPRRSMPDLWGFGRESQDHVIVVSHIALGLPQVSFMMVIEVPLPDKILKWLKNIYFIYLKWF